MLIVFFSYITISKPGDFIHTLGDAHVYNNHVAALEKQLEREPRPFPTLKISRQIDCIEDFKAEDFVLEGYDPHPKIHMDMAV